MCVLCVVENVDVICMGIDVDQLSGQITEKNLEKHLTTSSSATTFQTTSPICAKASGCPGGLSPASNNTGSFAMAYKRKLRSWRESLNEI